MAGSSPHFTAQQVIDAITQGHTPTGAASILKCDPNTIRNYAERYPTVKAALLEHRRQIVDIAELGLRAAVTRGEPWAVAFALKTLARETYSERIEHAGTDGGPVEIVLSWGDAAATDN